MSGHWNPSTISHKIKWQLFCIKRINISFVFLFLNSDKLTKLLLHQIQHWTSHELHVKWIRRIMKVNPQNLISDRSLMFGHLEKFLTMNWPLILLKTIRPGFNHPYIQMIDNPGKSNYQNNKDTFQAFAQAIHLEYLCICMKRMRWYTPTGLATLQPQNWR